MARQTLEQALMNLIEKYGIDSVKSAVKMYEAATSNQTRVQHTRKTKPQAESHKPYMPPIVKVEGA